MTGREFTELVDKFREDSGMSLMEFCSEEYDFDGLKWHSVGDNSYGHGSEYREWVCEYKGQFFRVTGYYASYAGYEIEDNDFEEVIPKQIQITVYKNK